MAAVAGSLGATIKIASTALATNFAYTASAYAALFTSSKGQTVGLVEQLGEFGAAIEVVTFTPLDTGITQKFKGPINYGQLTIGGALDLTDKGQALLYAAGPAVNQNVYPVKIVIVGAAAAKDTFYMPVKVMGFRFNIGQANTVARWTAPFEINGAVLNTST